MRDRFAFFGVNAGERRRIARAAEKQLERPGQDDVVAFARLAWADPEREMQYVACDHLASFAASATPVLIDDVEALIRSKSWWDTVDVLASRVVGRLVADHPGLVSAMDEWIDDSDHWIARAALLHQLRFGAETDTDRLFRYCRRRGADDGFFVRKAIGWALRQYSRIDPEAVAGFVDEHGDELSALSLREATKHLG
jgi:3-methyladenine DNA glycosylase AlkD